MAKVLERPLMRQKVNVSPVLLNKWKDNYFFDIRQVIHGSLMEKEDLYTKFEYKDRTFEIVGMGESRSIMLRETREEGIFYWECTRQFVQMCLGRFNQEFIKMIDGKTTLVEMAYETAQLLLPPKSNKRRKPAKPEEEETDFNETELKIESFEDVEDELDTIESEEI